jgi:hypothetical protein
MNYGNLSVHNDDLSDVSGGSVDNNFNLKLDSKFSDVFDNVSFFSDRNSNFSMVNLSSFNQNCDLSSHDNSNFWVYNLQL